MPRRTQTQKGKGPSSAWLHDPKMVLSHLSLKDGQVFADLGCGSGDYSLAASELIGSTGQVYALDKIESLTEDVVLRAKGAGLNNIIPLSTDLLTPLPLKNQSVDVAFIATVLHIFNLQKIASSFFREMHRILKPGGTLAILECKKEDRNFGPLKEMCNSPEEVQDAVLPNSFQQKGYTSFEHTYLLQFTAVYP